MRCNRELARCGVPFHTPPQEEPFGQYAGFHDPDGHEISLWQPPSARDRRHAMVAPLVQHSQSVVARLARR